MTEILNEYEKKRERTLNEISKLLRERPQLTPSCLLIQIIRQIINDQFEPQGIGYEKISPFIRNQMVAWKFIDDLLTHRIDEDNEGETKILAEIQAQQSIRLLKKFSTNSNISSYFTNEIKYYIKYWCKQGVNAESNNNRIITIVDKILRLID